MSQRIPTASLQLRQRRGALTIIAEESLANATLIQVYGRQPAEITRFAHASRNTLTAELAATRLRAVFPCSHRPPRTHHRPRRRGQRAS